MIDKSPMWLQCDEEHAHRLAALPKIEKVRVAPRLTSKGIALGCNYWREVETGKPVDWKKRMHFLMGEPNIA